MTFTKLCLYFVIQWLLLALIKAWLLGGQPVLTNPGLQDLLFWFLCSVVAVAIVRRFGVLNYLEVFFCAIVWTVGDSLFDLMFTSHYTGLQLFYRIDYWVCYPIIAVAIILFHKKRHVAVRNKQSVPTMGAH